VPFWSAVTGWPWSKQEMPGNPVWVVGEPGGTGPRLVFVNVPEAAELARLEALGARVIDDRRDVSPGGWVVLADPEGNEFDLEGGE
jgi:predicted enzyme related to lactoylglutathione lyase